MSYESSAIVQSRWKVDDLGRIRTVNGGRWGEGTLISGAFPMPLAQHIVDRHNAVPLGDEALRRVSVAWNEIDSEVGRLIAAAKDNAPDRIAASRHRLAEMADTWLRSVLGEASPHAAAGRSDTGGAA